ncbi:MAG: sulfur oxidation c-type cytochrome SoxX [Pelagibacterales bacterium]|nr:sulfur oxidation c-type cytochrome SoxX [Pelagibacterales bacterium]OUU63353.1 MAG: sulfur oxidation c-type cytochrome SoxX [Alphaproteobacteria bacterium TMED62]|tara:strand:+ start:12665 stop:13108 length:444 start_codon:yes stop_codon:yes gene_type:complete
MKYFITTILIFKLTTSFCISENNDYFQINYSKLIAEKKNKKLVGNISNGKEVFSSRKVNCLSCHEAPIKEEKFQGNFGPSLIGVGARYNKEEIRLRVIDTKIINPESIMPSYFKKINYARTPKNLLNKTILSAQEVEDIVEYLYSLK